MRWLKSIFVSLLLRLLLLIVDDGVAEVPLGVAPSSPNFDIDFANASTTPIAAINDDVIDDLKSSGVTDELRDFRQHSLLENEWEKIGKKIGRDPFPEIQSKSQIGNNVQPVPQVQHLTESWNQHPNRVEDISSFNFDSKEDVEKINFNDVAYPDSVDLRQSSKFGINPAKTEKLAELEKIHNTNSVIKTLPPFAFSSDDVGDDDSNIFTNVDRTDNVSPTTTTTTTTTSTPSTHPTLITGVNVLASSASVSDQWMGPPRAIPTTTPSTQIWMIPRRDVTLAISSDATTITTTTSPVPRQLKQQSEGSSPSQRIQETTRLLSLLGDKIGVIDQKALVSSTTQNQNNLPIVPQTGVLFNIYDRGRRNRRVGYRTKQWGRTSGGRRGRHHFDGQFHGVAHGVAKMKGGGYFTRKRVSSTVTGIGSVKGDKPSAHKFSIGKLRKQPKAFGFLSKTHDNSARGVRESSSTRRLTKPTFKDTAVMKKMSNFAEALMESEEESMRHLKQTLHQIRDVVNSKSASPIFSDSSIGTQFKGSFDFL